MISRYLGILVALTILVGFLASDCVMAETITEAQSETPSDQESEADRLLQQGIQYYRDSQFREAIILWTRSLQIYRIISDQLGKSDSLNN